MSDKQREQLITMHRRPAWDSERLLQSIRENHVSTCCLRMTPPLLLLCAALMQRGRPIAVVLLVCTALYLLIFGKSLLCDLRMISAPAKSRVFRKYGTPEQVAELLLDSEGKMRIFDNGQLLMNGELAVDRKNPESLLFLKDARLAYSQKQMLLGLGTRETLTVYDRWGEKHRYRVTGKGQFFRANVLLDRLVQNPECRIGNTPQNHKFLREKQEPL